jgi:hypothetical protein
MFPDKRPAVKEVIAKTSHHGTRNIPHNYRITSSLSGDCLYGADKWGIKKNENW